MRFRHLEFLFYCVTTVSVILSLPIFAIVGSYYARQASAPVLTSRKIMMKNVLQVIRQNRLINSTVNANQRVWLPMCSRLPYLIGPVNVTFEGPSSFETIALANPGLKPGGQFRPKDCEPEEDRVAIIIPFRNRTRQLQALLNHLHPILQRQQLDYRIFVVEQAGEDTFNKALLMNIAFKESQLIDDAREKFDCYIFHDVDLFTEDDRGLYQCAERPIHLSEYIDKFNYESWTGGDVLFGGVVSIKRRLFELVNGYSNAFFGWGGEDEEMRLRLLLRKIAILKPKKDFFRYKMAKHQEDMGNPWNEFARGFMSTTLDRMAFDGLNSMTYDLLKVENFPTHTHLLVNFTQEEVYAATFGNMTAGVRKRRPWSILFANVK